MKLSIQRAQPIHPVCDILTFIIRTGIGFIFIAVNAAVFIEIQVHLNDSLVLCRAFCHRPFCTDKRHSFSLSLCKCANTGRRYKKRHITNCNRPIFQGFPGLSKNLFLHLFTIVKLARVGVQTIGIGFLVIFVAIQINCCGSLIAIIILVNLRHVCIGNNQFVKVNPLALNFDIDSANTAAIRILPPCIKTGALVFCIGVKKHI